MLVICLSTQYAVSQQSDMLKTKSGELGIHPILHGSLILTFDDLTIAVDPYGGPERYKAFDAPDIVLLTDTHGDHLHQKTLAGLDLSNTLIIAPKAVFDQLTAEQQKITATLSNGQGIHRLGIFFQAVPMYNLPETPDSRHPKGRGNGYLLTIDGKNIYISGDTEDIPEMRRLQNIDVAFVCMNLPYTMDINQAADAVLDFAPAIVYPYHYRGSDVGGFKTLVKNGNSSIDVRLRNWYPDN